MNRINNEFKIKIDKIKKRKRLLNLLLVSDDVKNIYTDWKKKT